MFVYGLKASDPWVWPVFNQVFLMVYLSAWLRRSNAMTGAAWIETRFGKGKGAQLSHLIVVIFALVSVVGFLSYAFKGIGKFATDFLPWHLSANEYALILMAITTFYVVKGGMFSVVVTEVMQFCILSVSSIVLGIIAMRRVSPEMLQRVVPAGWDSPWFGWRLDLDWSSLIATVNGKIASDGYSLFGFFFMMLLFKGFLVSAAGPAPNYDMQRILSTRSPRDASLMNMWVNVVLIFPRYFLITGLTVLALVFFSDSLRGMGNNIDFEMILPYALDRFVPAGLMGLIVAGLLAAFMSNFAATVNAAPPYIVNDIYKRYINPHADERTYVRMSYAASLGVVILGSQIRLVRRVHQRVIGTTAALWGGYTASNVLKWYWWRFNGYGYSGHGDGHQTAGPLARRPAARHLGLQRVPDHPRDLPRRLLRLHVHDAARGRGVLKDFIAGCGRGGFKTDPPKVRRKTRLSRPTRLRTRHVQHPRRHLLATSQSRSRSVVIRKYDAALTAAAIVAVTAVILKLTWYDRLESREAAARAVPSP
jgi:Na+/proline symporter